MEGFKGCEDFDNNMIDATGLSIDKDSPTSTAMSGNLKLLQPLLDETEVIKLLLSIFLIYRRVFK